MRMRDAVYMRTALESLVEALEKSRGRRSVCWRRYRPKSVQLV